jgi:hypothetical protein
MNNYPEKFEIDRIYKFQRIRDGRAEEARFIVFDDGSARIIGALDGGCDNGPEAWKSAVKWLKREGFEFKEAGKIVRLEDFPPQPGEDPLAGGRRWSKALRSE